MANTNRKKINISILIPFAVMALLFALLVWKKIDDSREISPTPPPPHSETAELKKVVLLFASPDGVGLVKEGRELDSCGEEQQCLQTLLDELLNGSISDFRSAIPETTIIKSSAINQNIATVDLDESFAKDLPGGSNAEMLAVYAIVNTITINFPAVTGVQLTIEGKNDKVLKHLDLREPLGSDLSLIQEQNHENIDTKEVPEKPTQEKKGKQ